MQRTLLRLALAAILSMTTFGQEILTQWDFNFGGDATTTTGTTDPAVGTGIAVSIGGVSEAYATGSVNDPEPDDDSGWNLAGFPAQGESPRAAGAQFSAPTTGYESIVVKFDWRASNTGSGRLVALYTTDGSIWTEAATFTIDQGAWWFPDQAVDLTEIPAVNDNPNFAVRLVSDFADGSAYVAAKPGSNYGTTGTWRFDMVTVLGLPLGTGPTAPSILTQPQGQTVTEGDDVTLGVVVTGTPPLSYQWYFNDGAIDGETSGTLSLLDVATTQSGFYHVVVSNAQGEAISEAAELIVEAVQEPELTDISVLRALLDTENYLPTDTDTLFTVEGIVTTHTSLTGTPNALFYMQDDTAGIAVYWRGGANVFLPAAGDKLRVTAKLDSFNGLLELTPSASDATTEVTLLNGDNPLPEPTPLDFFSKYDPATMEALEGTYVIAANVNIDPSTPVFPASGTVDLIDEIWETFPMYVDARTDIGGQPAPLGATDVIGVLGQYNSGMAATEGYQIIPSRYADIVSVLKPPTIVFTNVLSNLVRPGDLPENDFTEHGLRPGETLTTTFFISDEEGRPISITSGLNVFRGGQPTSATWDFPTDPTGDTVGTFTWTPEEPGQFFEARLTADNGVAENVLSLRLYTPTEAEQQVVISEYFANPTSNADLPHYNPLLRDPPVAIDMTINDEYIELANLSDEPIDLLDWTMSDGVGLRHRFYTEVTLGAKSAVVLYGGPLNGYPPLLDVPAEPGSGETSFGLALNNAGDTITIRNAIGGIIARVIYPGGAVSSGGSMTRYPTINGGFRSQVDVSDLVVTPGRQYDGKLWSEPPTIPPADVGSIAAARNGDGSITLTWQAEAGQTYGVEAAAAVSGPFSAIANGLTTGEYTDTQTGDAVKFYRVGSP